MADGFGLYTFVDPADVRRVRYIAAHHPKAIARAWNGVTLRAANTLRKVLRVGGGEHGVPAFDAKSWVSDTLRPGAPFGGSLPRRFIARWRQPGSRGATQFVGFIDKVPFAGQYAELLQTSEHRAFSQGEARYLAYRLKTFPKFPYARPARPLIEPFAREMPRIFRKHLVPAIEKSLRQLARKGAL